MANVPNLLKLYGKSADLTDISTTDEVGVGRTRIDENGNKYRWVKNVDTTAFVATQPVAWDSAANVGTTDYYKEVTRVVNAELMNMAGLAMGAIGASGGSMYGWVQVWGHFTDAPVITPATGGNDIEEGSELIGVDKQEYLTYGGNAATGAAYSNHFRALEVLATATGAAETTLDIFIYCV